MTGWTKQASSTWVVFVFLCVMGVAVEETKALDLGVCQSSCSAVPIDLWPYCCETHSTCCEVFAHSCIHDCLPRVSTGDVSAVEERPGLCCALYNLCCFRETPRIFSIRNGAVPQQSFPVTHRFSTLPGGGGPTRTRNRQSQSSIVTPQQTTTTINKPPKPVQQQEKDDSRRPGTFNRPQPARKTASSFRDAQRSKKQEDTRTGISNSPQANKRPNHRFDIREPNNARPTISESSKPQVQELKSEQLSRPQVSELPSKPRKFNRPGSLTRPLETRKTDTPEAKEPSEELTNTKIPKVIDRLGPRKLVRPEPINLPTNPRKLDKPESETHKETEQDTQEKERKSSKLFPNRPLQSRKSTQSVPTDQPPKPQEDSVQVDRPSKIARPGLLNRPGQTRKNIRPALDVTEKPEKVSKPESDDSPRRPRLLVNRPNIKNQRLDKTDSDVDTPPKSGIDSDQVRSRIDAARPSLKKVTLETPLEIENLSKDTSNTGNAYLPEKVEKPVAEEGEKGPSIQTSTAAEVTRKGNISPIRKVKRIRTNAPSPRKPSQELGTSNSQKTNTETVTVTPTARPRVTRGRSRIRLEVTTFRPQPTQERSRGSTRVTQERSRENTRDTQERSRGNTQVTQERTRGNTQVAQESSRVRTQEISRGHTQATQERSRERTQIMQERSGGRIQTTEGRSRSQVTRRRPTENAQTVIEMSEDGMKVQEDSTNRPLAEEIPEISTDIPTIKEEKIMTVPEEMEKLTVEDSQTTMDKLDDEPQVTTETPQEPREKPTNRPQIKVMKLVRPHVAIKNSGPEEAKEKPDHPQEITQAESQSQTKQGSEPQSTRQRSSAQVTRQSSEPQQSTRQSSEPQQATRQRSSAQPATRQRSSAQPATRQRSSAQPATRQRSDRQQAPRQPTARTRGSRLTARQQLALQSQS